MSIPLRLGAANYWIRDKVLFSARSLCALKTGCGERGKKKAKKSSPILGSERATGSEIDQVENLCVVGAIST